MMTRRQLHFAAGCAGILLGIVACCFVSEQLITWFWAAPLIVLALVLLVVSGERRVNRRGHKAFRAWG